MKEKLLIAYKQLPARDRQLACFGVAALVLFLLYLTIYTPISKSIEQKRHALIEATHTLHWIDNMRPHLKQRKPLTVLNGSHLLTEFSTQLKQSSFQRYPFHMQQTDAHEILLTFEEVPYTEFIAWLFSMSNTYAFSIKQLQVTHTSKPGIVHIAIGIEVR